jgi:HEPN domain-containing protein
VWAVSSTKRRKVIDEETSEYMTSLLRRRSKQALERAKRNLEAGDYDGAAFDAEQAVQLYLKSIIHEYTSAVPRIHNIRELLGLVGSLLGIKNHINEFVRENRLKLIALEDAYYNARHLPKEYDKETAEDLIRFAREVIDFVESKRSTAKKGYRT